MSIESYLCYTDEWLKKSKQLHLSEDESFASLGETQDSRIRFYLQLLNGIIEVSIAFGSRGSYKTSVSYLLFDDKSAASYPLAGGEIASQESILGGGIHYVTSVAQKYFERGELLMLITVGSDLYHFRVSDCLPYMDLDQDKYSGDHNWGFSL
jgi:hypothetical protein